MELHFIDDDGTRFAARFDKELLFHEGFAETITTQLRNLVEKKPTDFDSLPISTMFRVD